MAPTDNKDCLAALRASTLLQDDNSTVPASKYFEGAECIGIYFRFFFALALVCWHCHPMADPFSTVRTGGTCGRVAMCLPLLF